jgi:hypothetical protein
MGESDHLIDLNPLVELERGRLGHIEDLDLALPQFHLAGREVGVHRALGPATYDTGDANNELAAQIMSPIDDTLDESGVIAQVDEGEMLAVLASTSNPPTD